MKFSIDKRTLMPLARERSRQESADLQKEHFLKVSLGHTAEKYHRGNHYNQEALGDVFLF
jgi:hypothetical protein